MHKETGIDLSEDRYRFVVCEVQRLSEVLSVSAIELAIFIVVIIMSVRVGMAVAIILAESTTRLIQVVLPQIVF